MNTRDESLIDTGRTSPSMMTCEPSRPLTGNGVLTSSAAGSPVKTLAEPESRQASPGSDPGCGANMPGYLGCYDPASHSLRTSQNLLFADLTASSVTLPRSGSMQNGALFLRPPWALPTFGRGYSLLPTPTAGACVGCSLTLEMGKRFLRKGRSGSFVEAMAAALLPTLSAREGKDWSRMGLLASLDRGDGVAKRICRLSPLTRSEEGIGGLNPCFGEWMMGFPEGWTDCDAQAMP